MKTKFDSFVIFAEMRTGSNFLETNLNAVKGIHCFGEAFNPHFIGYPNKTSLLGVTLEERDDFPETLLQKIKETEGIGGFRFFHDHDQRVLQALLSDHRCAKIILTRNPLDSFISWKIAQQTDQWKLTDVTRRRGAKAQFDPVEFARYLKRLQGFQVHVRQQLQHSGQTAFHLDYDDLQSVDVINGLSAFLGTSGCLKRLDKNLKVQNPAPLAEKVKNQSELDRVLASTMSIDIHSPAILEPKRAAAVKSYVTGVKAPLIYLPVRGAPDDIVLRWLADLDGVSVSELQTGLSQKDIRQWKRTHAGHRSFTVVRHPLVRAHYAYCKCFLPCGDDEFAGLRKHVERFGDGTDSVEMLKKHPGVRTHREYFKTFLTFLKANLSGQTALRVNALWASQAQIIAGFSQFATPDMVMREDDLDSDLPALAQRVGYASHRLQQPKAEMPISLCEIYDDEIETLARRVFQRDYIAFGFDNWR